MAMRGAYGQLSYRDQPTTQTSPDVDRWFAQTIPNSAEAVFYAGWASNRWSQRLVAETSNQCGVNWSRSWMPICCSS
ncbi:hypothetical protein ACVWW1_002684 [Bradyrhizobium sp. JR3.5]